VENEKGEKERTATEGLMWLLRGLSFTGKALQESQNNKGIELSAAFNLSYQKTLKKHHGMLVRPVFAVSYILFFPPLLSPRLNGVMDGSEGNEARFVHIRGSAATFFLFVQSRLSCIVFDVADAVPLNLI
jgi:hypothetical protein